MQLAFVLVWAQALTPCMIKNTAKGTCVAQDHLEYLGAIYYLVPCDELSFLQAFTFLWNSFSMTSGRVGLFGFNACVDAQPLLGVSMYSLDCDRSNINQFWVWDASTGNMRSVYKNNFCWDDGPDFLTANTCVNGGSNQAYTLIPVSGTPSTMDDPLQA